MLYIVRLDWIRPSTREESLVDFPMLKMREILLLRNFLTLSVYRGEHPA